MAKSNENRSGRGGNRGGGTGGNRGGGQGGRGGQGAGWPSKTGNPSGGGRTNAPPKLK